MNADDVNAGKARDDLEMVRQILAQSHQRLCAGGEYFVVWGLFSGGATVAGHLISVGTAPLGLLWAVAALLAACIAFSVIRARALSGAIGRESLVQREFFYVLWLAVALAFFVNVAVFRVFSGLASAGIWSFSEALVLLYVGLHGNRCATVCAALVMVSMVLANFGPAHLSAYILAAGMIAGYTGFGLAELLSKE
jgi:hypothetical protein